MSNDENEVLHQFVLNFDIIYGAVSLKWKNFDFWLFFSLLLTISLVRTAFKISLKPHLIKT